MSEGERYRLIRRIDQGGMAEVYEAEVVRPGFTRRVAVKRLLAEHLGDPEAALAFADEARVIGQLQHPGIIGILDFGVLDGAPFQVLELVDGPSLLGLEARAIEAKVTLLPEVWLAIVAEVALSLDFAHKARDPKGRPLGVVHRDVSPSNVLLSANGDVKLGDFGIAIFRERRAKTTAGIVKGQLPYMAPEQLAGKALDGRADVFALGCVLHRMLTGRSPLDSQEARTKMITDRVIALDAGLDADLSALLGAACRPDAALRTATAAAFHSDVLGVLERRGVRDGRSLLRQTAERLRPPLQPPKGLLELMDVELVLDEAPAPVRRYSTIHRPSSDRPQVTRPGGGTFAGYRLEARLGDGGFAEVWRARHSESAQVVALKVMHASLIGSVTARRRFERELVTLRTVRHPSLVEILDSGVAEDGRAFLAMELLAGPTLRTLVKERGRLDLHEVTEIAKGIVAGLAALHRAQIVHRDLKPTNLMMVEGRPKIVDFGLAVLLDPDSELTRFTAVERVIGTPRWMAPEQIVDPSRVGPPADMYGVGLLLHWMITGQHPFRGPRSDLLQQHLASEPGPAVGAGPLQPIIRRLLSKRPEDRPSAEGLGGELDALVIEPEDEAQRPTALVVPVLDDDSTSGSADTEDPPGTAAPTRLSPTRAIEPRSTAEAPSRWWLPAIGLLIAATALLTVAVRSPAEAPTELVDPALPVTADPAPIVEARPGVEPSALGLEPAEDLPPPPDPLQPPPPTKVRGRKDAGASTEDRDAQVGAMLAARGLTRRDLALLPPLERAVSMLDRVSDQGAALAELRVAIERFQIEPGLVTARLERFRGGLEDHVEQHPDADVRGLEAAYLDVRSAAPRAETFDARLALLRRLGELESRLPK